MEFDDPGVVVTAVKQADDGDGVIVRFHEAFGGWRRVRVRVAGATGAQRVDLLERSVLDGQVDVADGAVSLDLDPFEMVTLRLEMGNG